MARRKSDTPQKAAMREMMQGYLRDNDISIKSGTDVNSIMRDMMSVLLEEPHRSEYTLLSKIIECVKIVLIIKNYLIKYDLCFRILV